MAGFKQTVRLKLVKNHHKIERTRLLGELVACGFVAVETHFILFSVVLVVWFVADVLYWMEGGEA